MDKQFRKIQEMCNNGTHSCLIQSILNKLQISKKQLVDLLDEAPFSYRYSKNVNGMPLLVLE